MSVRNAPRCKNHEAVMAVLEKAGKPMTAYEILDCLRGRGITAPPTVYRALERLRSEGRVHRLESLNAFIPCQNTHRTDVSVFAICDDCGRVEEVADPALEQLLVTTALKQNFIVSRSMIEMHGQCRDCHCEEQEKVAPDTGKAALRNIK